MRYSEEQSDLLRRRGVLVSASSLLERWDAFVDECEEGYRWDYSEYLSEVEVRAVLEGLEVDQGLNRYAEHQEFLGNLGKIDRRFSALLHPLYQTGDVGDPWWRRGVLRRAGAEYAGYFRKAFSFDVEIV
jgi:hypothetical protein